MNKNRQLRVYLEDLAIQYETEEFLKDDPSIFMHQVYGKKNQEVMAFIASCLSYGSRKQFFPKIQFILEKSKYEPYLWVKTGAFHQDIPALQKCYYRLYTYAHLNHFLRLLQQLLIEYVQHMKQLRIYVVIFLKIYPLLSFLKIPNLLAKEFVCFSDGWFAHIRLSI